MNTEVQLDSKGLDASGKSTHTLRDLIRRMKDAKTIALIFSAFTEIIFASARLTIRRDGTYLTLPNREHSSYQTLASTATLLDAMTQAAINPGDKTASELRKAELAFDEHSLNCVKLAIKKVCSSKEIKIPISIGQSTIDINIPHKSILALKQDSESQEHGEGHGKIGKIRPYVNAVSNSGLAALITKTKATPEIKVGDKLLVSMNKQPKKFLLLQDKDRSGDEQ